MVGNVSAVSVSRPVDGTVKKPKKKKYKSKNGPVVVSYAARPRHVVDMIEAHRVPNQWTVVCSCGQRGPQKKGYQEALRWADRHVTDKIVRLT